MALKFYLNKYIKADNIENYTLNSLKVLQDEYSNFLEKSEGIDPDFPMFNFGGKNKLTKTESSSSEEKTITLGGREGQENN